MKYYLSKLSLYRKWKGGRWYLVRPKIEYGIYGCYWINRDPLFNEDVVKMEIH
jgi:hypothetical protein